MLQRDRRRVSFTVETLKSTHQLTKPQLIAYSRHEAPGAPEGEPHSAQTTYGLHSLPVLPPVQLGPSLSAQSHSPSSAFPRLGGENRVCMLAVADVGGRGEHSDCIVIANSIRSDWLDGQYTMDTASNAH